jgi:hypothetical protein
VAADGARNVDVELHVWIKDRNADGLELQNGTKLTTQYRDSVAADCLHLCFPPLSDATLPVLIAIIGTAGWCRDVFLHVGLCLSVVVFEVTERHLLVFIPGTSGLSHFLLCRTQLNCTTLQTDTRDWPPQRRATRSTYTRYLLCSTQPTKTPSQ